MSDSSFQVDGVDHGELFVRDWDEAAAWYERVLGLTPESAYEEWWTSDDGPLVLSTGDGATMLALFERETATGGESVSPHRVAFRTDADGFLALLDRLERLDLTDRDGTQVTPSDAVDHDLSYSVYFTDPDGNRLEVTTPDRDAVAESL